MWRTDTLWFDAVVVLVVVLGLSSTVGRAWAFGVLTLPLLGAAWIHLVWLPKHGINGWTGEPRDKYLELVDSRRKRT